jgi:hypothetical protein
LVFKGAVTDFALVVEEHGPMEQMAGFALVEPGMAALPRAGVGQPLQGEQRAFDPADGAKRTRQCVARAGHGELTEDHGWRDRTRLDRGFETDCSSKKGLRFMLRSSCGPERASNWISPGATSGAKTAYIEPGSPWENGYVEGFNGKFRDGLLVCDVFNMLVEAQVLIEQG